MQPWMLFSKKKVKKKKEIRKNLKNVEFFFPFCFLMVIRSLPVDNISSSWQQSMVESYSGSFPCLFRALNYYY